MIALTAKVNNLIARLGDRDEGIEGSLDHLERRINRHRVEIDGGNSQVSP